MVRNASKPNPWNRDRERQEEKACELVVTESFPQIPEHSKNTCRKKISLHRRTEVLGRPTSHRPINCQGRAVHAISAAQYACNKTASEKPCLAVAFEARLVGERQGIDCKAK